MSMQHVATTARPSHLCVPFSEKLNRSLDRLDNRLTMHGSPSDTLEWVRSQKYDDYYNGVMLLVL
jgi:hypothetical protein